MPTILDFIVVATTRPETMLGDTAVAVHPDDERYHDLVGQTVILPLVGRRIPIVADDYSDPEKGTGAVKITPAHDFNDFEVGKRHHLAQVNTCSTLKASSTLKDNERVPRIRRCLSPPSLTGDTCKLARCRPLRRAQDDRRAARGRGSPRQDRAATSHAVPHGDRSSDVIEPFLTDQWYVNAKALAVRAIDAVREGETTFVPKNWEKTYFDWMENIQPWCISRQLWWGHQIPAWYGPDGKVCVAETEDEAVARERFAYYVETGVLRQHQAKEMIEHPEKRAPIIMRDEDVLDTWFSSALWPFSTLGWPDETPELKRFYPTATLVTGFDIIFFWVARMMMMGLHFMQGRPPGRRAVQGRLHPCAGARRARREDVEVEGQHHRSAAPDRRLRRRRAALHARRHGGTGPRHQAFDQRVESERNFATKLWNAARFAEMNGCALVRDFDPRTAKETLNRWIAHETAKAAREVTAALEAYKFNEAAMTLRALRVERLLRLVSGTREAGAVGWRTARPGTKRAPWSAGCATKSASSCTRSCRSSPRSFGRSRRKAAAPRHSLLVLAAWPQHEGLDNPDAEAEIGWVIDLVTAIRSVRSEMNITSDIPVVLVGASEATQARAGRWTDIVRRLARLSGISAAATAPPGSVQLLVRGEVVALPLKGVIDFAAEKARLEKEMAKVASDIARIDAKLGNADFVAKAREEVVEGEREKREEAEQRRVKINEALQRLKDAA